MNDLLRDKLATVVEDELLLEALKAVFDERIAIERPHLNETDNNTLLGEKYRAYNQSEIIIEKAFADLMSYKIGKKNIKNINKGR